MRSVVSLVCLSGVALGVRAFAGEADWPQFRGPGGQATSQETGLPLAWSADQNILWKTALPGYGASSPIAVGERIFVACYSGYGASKESPGGPKSLLQHLVCINRGSGKIEWDQSVPGKPSGDYGGFIALHGYASGTPASDGKAVYAFFGPTGMFCLLYTSDAADE